MVYRFFLSSILAVGLWVPTASHALEDVVLYKTPYALLLEPHFTVSSREIAQQVLSDENNFMQRGAGNRIVQSFRRSRSKALYFRFMDITLKEANLQPSDGQILVKNTQEISFSPQLKTADDVITYLEKTIFPKKKIINLVIKFERVPVEKKGK